MILRSCLLGGTLLLSARLACGVDSVPVPTPTSGSGAPPPAGLTPFATSTHVYAQGIPTGQAIRGDYGGALRPRVHYSPPVVSSSAERSEAECGEEATGRREVGRAS